MANRIHSKGEARHEEAVIGEAGIYPGMLIMLDSDGEIMMHDTEGGYAEVAVAEEDALQGNTVSTVYTLAAVGSYLLPVKGAEIRGLIAAGQDIVIGEKLISAGDGTWESYDDSASGITSPRPLAVAMEAVDLSASGAVDTLGRLRVL